MNDAPNKRYRLERDAGRIAGGSLRLVSLWQPGRHLENNLSYYFSRNTHLLGEAVALHSLLVPARELPLLGDDDGGRLFHPYGPQAEFGRATLATCSAALEKTWRFEARDLPPQAAWWLGEEAFSAAPRDVSPAGSRLFASSGVAVMQAGEMQVVVDAGPFGPGRAGHSHSDCLNILVRRGREEILVDAGTYTYVGDAQWRDWFRGSAAHNVVRRDGLDQATPAGPFAWTGAPQIERAGWVSGDDKDYLDATCRFRGFAHRRRVLFRKPDLILIVDGISGPGVHRVEQFWHAGAALSRLSGQSYRIGSARLTFSPAREVELECGGRNGWRSTAPGVRSRRPAFASVLRGRCRFGSWRPSNLAACHTDRRLLPSPLSREPGLPSSASAMWGACRPPVWPTSATGSPAWIKTSTRSVRFRGGARLFTSRDWKS